MSRKSGPLEGLVKRLKRYCSNRWCQEIHPINVKVGQVSNGLIDQAFSLIEEWKWLEAALQ